MARTDPPTEKQLNRIQQLMNHPGMAVHLENLEESRMKTWLNTQAGCGIAINWMKGKIRKWEEDNQ